MEATKDLVAKIDAKIKKIANYEGKEASLICLWKDTDPLVVLNKDFELLHLRYDHECVQPIPEGCNCIHTLLIVTDKYVFSQFDNGDTEVLLLYNSWEDFINDNYERNDD